MTIYRVEAYAGWHLVKANNEKDARRDAAIDYGTSIKSITKATEDDINWYTNQRGEINEASND